MTGHNVLKIQNPELKPLIHHAYTLEELAFIEELLTRKGCFDFTATPNGLFPAVPSADSGYRYIWVRDNVYIAHAHYVRGDRFTASRTASSLLRYFKKYKRRFIDIIESRSTPEQPMNRPHIRFQGDTLSEINQKWPHAQNDALGYFLWLYCKLAREAIVPCNDADLECLALFPAYFRAIAYWQDRDSGHWEETRKVSASSIGTVIAGLAEFEKLSQEKKLWSAPVMVRSFLTPEAVQNLLENGRSALAKILPCESVEPKEHYRRYDSALLFLIYPLDVLTDTEANQVLDDIGSRLKGEYGIRRYPNDSYWFPDCKNHFPFAAQPDDSIESTEKRDAYIKPGEEAQWCIFDPILSVIHGKRYLAKKKAKAKYAAEEESELQTEYFNRSLGQLTEQFRSPEAYYLVKGIYLPNDNTPLFWSQANLWTAFHAMRQSMDSERPA